MTLLSKEQILKQRPFTYEDVKAFGGLVRVREMSGNMRDEYEAHIITVRNEKAEAKMSLIRATLLAFTIVDEKGKRIFSNDDIEAVGEQPIGDIQRLFNVASKLNVLSQDDVEDLKGNSDGVPSEDSTTN